MPRNKIFPCGSTGSRLCQDFMEEFIIVLIMKMALWPGKNWESLLYHYLNLKNNLIKTKTLIIMKRIYLIIAILVAATRRNDYSFINNNPRPLALNHPSFLRGVYLVLM